MALYPIFHRWSVTPIVLVEATSFTRALEQATERHVKLRYADLRGIVAPGAALEGADLGGADLSNSILPGAGLEKTELRSARLTGAFLQEANLRKADLREADLRKADLRVADLQGARLTGSDLRGALFYGAKLEGAVLDWRWCGIPLELLRQEHNRGEGAIDVAIDPESAGADRPFAWLKALLAQGTKADRALRVLSRYLQPGDNAPELLRKLAADASTGPSTSTSTLTDPGRDIPGFAAADQASGASPMLWTRRRTAREKPVTCKFG